ncbi:hypothetical protein EZV62_025128 [Acer yangbiense]|uniref:Pectinesterase n=1 Tax=Acer yangbiense TaxID=1000413 RepID=A0A5C7GWX2_9ROSI|nr:hypothetical protein EZV62_025128 [Acer yangbiense]
MSSFLSYGKVNEFDQAKLESRRRTRRRIIIIGLSTIVLVAIVVAAVLGSASSRRDPGSKNGKDGRGTIAALTVCNETLYKETCYKSLANATNMGQMGFEDFFRLSIKVALDELSKASEYFSKNASVFSGVNDTMTVTALNNCGELMSLALDHLNSSLSSSSGSSVLDAVNDLKTWLSSSGTYQQTCIDGFQEIENGEKYKSGISENLKTSTELTSNSLAIITWISKVANSVKLRKLLANSDQEPEWLRPEDRKLMTDQGSDLKKKADFVVAKDGSSKYKTIMAALNDVPEKSKKRLIIYVKSGVYFENVRVEKTKCNVTMIGDGLNATIVSGSLNVIDGTPTFSTATFGIFSNSTLYSSFLIIIKALDFVTFCHVESTQCNLRQKSVANTTVTKSLSFIIGKKLKFFNICHGFYLYSLISVAAVFGQGFVARDMGFRNTAGPSKHQAVALMSTADCSAFYRCHIDAFQDTLYTLSNRQFYRECNIYGTVDFIFGNSEVVLQNCNIAPKKPLPGQQNTITAQGRMDPNQNTGISIQNCSIWPNGNLSGVETYLGRPWKNYSTTIFMQSNMESFINPSGWLPWIGTSGPDTIFYTEFQNYGPGSSTKNRVKWIGVKNITQKEANKFTVKPFLQGDKWIPNAAVTYKSGL